MFSFGFFVHSIFGFTYKKSNNEKEYRGKNTDFPFVSPLLECEGYQAVELSSFKDKLKELTDDFIRNKSINEASVYFRDLNNGLWVEINGDYEFAPASLLKVPLAMSYLKKEETENGFLDKEVLLSDKYEKNSVSQNYKPEKKLALNKNYSLKELLEEMIIFSDNTAQNFLLEYAPSFWRDSFRYLGIIVPGENRTDDFLSVKDYARFFRVLYNASYLNEEDSNYLLNLLSQTKFTDGLLRGLPNSVSVSHKFGERVFDDYKQLHDCGIVYVENSPYVLCVMSKGDDFKKMSSYIGEVSKLIYEEVETQRIYSD